MQNENNTPEAANNENLFEEVEMFSTALIQGGSTFAPWTPADAEGDES